MVTGLITLLNLIVYYKPPTREKDPCPRPSKHSTYRLMVALTNLYILLCLSVHQQNQPMFQLRHRELINSYAIGQKI